VHRELVSEDKLPEFLERLERMQFSEEVQPCFVETIAVVDSVRTVVAAVEQPEV
jgi:hypothetical protein